jgi:predicted enzyme related to lactoylglutathione lyase
MAFSISATQLWVRDQDEAIDFWTKRVGMELQTDATLPEMGNFRWVTVGPVGQPDVRIVLMAIPGEPMMDEASAAEVRALMAKGYAGAVFLATDDVHADFRELSSRGVEFTSEPFETPYGIDSGFRDPSGNTVRLTQIKADWVDDAVDHTAARSTI